MKDSLRTIPSFVLYLLRYFLFWWLLFTFQRILFLLHFASDLEAGLSQLLSIPFHAFRLDFTAFAYLFLFPALMVMFSLFAENKPKKWLLNTGAFSTLLLAIGSSIIATAEIVTYSEWRAKLSSKIFIHFETPDEIFRTGAGSNTTWFVFYLVLQLTLIFFLHHWLFRRKTYEFNQYTLGWKSLRFVTILPIMAFALVVGMRGGLQQIPITATSAYFSTHQIVNDASVNTTWNFINVTYFHFKMNLDEYFNYLNETEATAIKDELFLYPPCDSVQVLKNDRPNIILITLEGWSAQMIEPLGGEPGITPYFNQLCEEGLLFTRMYATTSTSENGHTSILSGHQTIPAMSISIAPSKCRNLPGITKTLKQEGYENAYYFGGDLSYGNIGGYLAEMRFDKIQDENQLSLQPTGKLGIHDEAMFSYLFDEVEKAKRPYFYGLFTQSTHAPYDMPGEWIEGYPEDSRGYVTSLLYADKHLKAFTEKVKQLPDFDNTLVIFIADHGKTHYKNNDVYIADYYHIPCLWWGGALKNEYRGRKVEKLCSQADLSKTLLHQMRLPTDDFEWSKDALNPQVQEWAVVTANMAYGIILPDGFVTWQMIERYIINHSFSTDEERDAALNKARAIIEGSYRAYKNL